MRADEIIGGHFHEDTAVAICWLSSLEKIALSFVEGWNDVFEIAHVC